jgi:rhomboid family GlyGly-CTERM serine protease
MPGVTAVRLTDPSHPFLFSMHLRLPVQTLLIAVLSVGISLLPDAATTGLQFDREAIAAGQWWRLITAHVTHFDANHLAWDVGALLALGMSCERASRSRVALALGLGSFAISAAVWFFQPQFTTYRGLSGLDSALFGLFATTLIQQRCRGPMIVGLVALVGFSVKCLFEVTTGTTAFASGSGYSPVPLAHLVGLICGIAGASIVVHARRTTGISSLATVALCEGDGCGQASTARCR